MNPEDQRQIARIDQISGLARTSWIGLLAYLAFTFVTLLGVEDADFFVPSRQTQLPLVNVSIPTASFFIFAPVLGAALYVYLHLFLIKLWDAIADAKPTIRTDSERNKRIPLSEAIHPWLATAMRGNGARPEPDQPMRWLSTLVTWALVWIAGPFVLLMFWWWSAPAHNEGLTLLIALCLFVATIAGSVSWYRARARLSGREPAFWRSLCRWIAAICFGLVLVAISWVRTEGGVEHWVAWGSDQIDTVFKTGLFKGCAPDDAGATPDDCIDGHGVEWPPDILKERRIAARFLATDDLTFTETDWPLSIWLADDNYSTDNTWNALEPTSLSGEALGAAPPDWLDHDIARRRAREAWCKGADIPLEACDLIESDIDAAANLWCGERENKAACPVSFRVLVARFDEEWRIDRAAYLDNLTTLDLSGRDLRQADLADAFLSASKLRLARMEGADLSGARLEGADLTNARMEGAVLTGARMEGARLAGARLEGAILKGARMERAKVNGARMAGALLGGTRMQAADLTRARLERAFLTEARMERAILRWSRMEGARLGDARMDGADLRFARMEGALLNGASMEGADLGGVDFRSADWAGGKTGAPAHAADLRGAIGLTQDQLDRMIGDVRTLLPETLEDGSLPSIPSCWAAPPSFFEAMIDRMAFGNQDLENTLRAEFLCPEGTEPARTGTPLALDAPYPDGHPLADRED